jgi:hypothetical protein
MRHFEEFELEHLFNRTGNFLLRWRCRNHLKKCDMCRRRMAKIMDDRQFAERLKSGVERIRQSSEIIMGRKNS